MVEVEGLLMDKSVRRQAQAKKDRFGPKGTPKFLLLMIEQQHKRDQKKIEGAR